MVSAVRSLVALHVAFEPVPQLLRLELGCVGFRVIRHKPNRYLLPTNDYYLRPSTVLGTVSGRSSHEVSLLEGITHDRFFRRPSKGQG